MAEIILRIMAVVIVGFNMGMVILRKTWNFVPPKIYPASLTSAPIPCNPASRIIMTKGITVHASMIIMSHIVDILLPARKRILLASSTIPACIRKLFSHPLVARPDDHMAPTATAGRAMGIIARKRKRDEPLNFVLINRASPKARTNSIVTENITRKAVLKRAV